MSRLRTWSIAIIAACVLARAIFVLAFFWKQSMTTAMYGAVLCGVVLCIAVAGRLQWKQMRPLALVVCAQGVIELLGHLFGGVLPRNAVFNAFAWYGAEEPRARFVWGAVMSLACAWALAEPLRVVVQQIRMRVQWDERNRFRAACIASGMLAAYSGILVVMRHQSFLTTAFDLSIFDQALFQFSRFTAPVSTVRQFTNLFLDHQHFAIILLAPLYWFWRGMHGILLVGVSSFLLVTFPSIMLARAWRAFTGKQAAWVVLLATWILWVHPFTQQALKFTFHEKYLIPLFLSTGVYALARYIRERHQRHMLLASVMVLLWLLTKEDQWIFICAALVQLVIHLFLWSRDRILRRMLTLWAVGMGVLCIVYARILHYFSDQLNPTYKSFFTPARDAVLELVRTGDISQYVSRLHLLNDAALYLYQHLLGIDILGAVAMPLNILGNYTERLASSLLSHRSPAYQYGVDVPVYVVMGVLAAILIAQHFKKTYAERLPFFAAIALVTGFVMICGWNNMYYLNGVPHEVVRDYISTAPRRAAFMNAIAHIPADASVVAAEGYAPHLSARQQSIRWPDEVNWPEGTPGKVDMMSYEYWVLPPQPFLPSDTTEYQVQIDALEGQGYVVLVDNEYVVVLKK